MEHINKRDNILLGIYLFSIIIPLGIILNSSFENDIYLSKVSIIVSSFAFIYSLFFNKYKSLDAFLTGIFLIFPFFNLFAMMFLPFVLFFSRIKNNKRY